MKIEEFDYYLPEDLIAQNPCIPRDRCRLLVLHKNGKIEHRFFYHITDYLEEGDVLVINTTRVIPARLLGRKEKTGGKVEVLLLKKNEKNCWQCILKPFRKIKEGQSVIFADGKVRVKILKKEEKNTALVNFEGENSIEDILSRVGKIPLPPYIKRYKTPTPDDETLYQTVYAKESGAIAAPTAGLHFTEELLERIEKKGVKIKEVVLHTSRASFFFLEEKEVEKNRLPSEYFKIPPSTACEIKRCREKGKKVVAVGTTTVRALETNSKGGEVLPGEGWTDLFIYPGYRFKTVDVLITNFHMPRSSLLLLVSAFVGREKLMRAYREAVEKKYRFLSYGDAMLII